MQGLYALPSTATNRTYILELPSDIALSVVSERLLTSRYLNASGLGLDLTAISWYIQLL